jgi:hypothetical protein
MYSKLVVAAFGAMCALSHSASARGMEPDFYMDGSMTPHKGGKHYWKPQPTYDPHPTYEPKYGHGGGHYKPGMDYCTVGQGKRLYKQGACEVQFRPFFLRSTALLPVAIL